MSPRAPRRPCPCVPFIRFIDVRGRSQIGRNPCSDGDRAEMTLMHAAMHTRRWTWARRSSGRTRPSERASELLALRVPAADPDKLCRSAHVWVSYARTQVAFRVAGQVFPVMTCVDVLCTRLGTSRRAQGRPSARALASSESSAALFTSASSSGDGVHDRVQALHRRFSCSQARLRTIVCIDERCGCHAHEQT
jgi:hypothetical protein